MLDVVPPLQQARWAATCKVHYAGDDGEAQWMMYWTPWQLWYRCLLRGCLEQLTRAMLACPSRRCRLEMRHVRDSSSRPSRNGTIPLLVWAVSCPAEEEVELRPSSASEGVIA